MPQMMPMSVFLLYLMISGLMMIFIFSSFFSTSVNLKSNLQSFPCFSKHITFLFYEK